MKEQKLSVEFVQFDGPSVNINIGLATQFADVKEQIKKEIKTDYFQIKKIIPRQENEQQKFQNIELNKTISQYVDPELTVSFAIIKQIPFWIYNDNLILKKSFELGDTLEDILTYAFGANLNKEQVKLQLMSNDLKKIQLIEQDDYLNINVSKYQQYQFPIHLYIKSKIPNQELQFQNHKSFNQKNNKKKKQQFQQHIRPQIQKQEQLHYSVEIDRRIDQEKLFKNQGSFDMIIGELKKQILLLQQVKLKYIQQFENLKQLLDQYLEQINVAKQSEENALNQKKYHKKNSSQNLRQNQNEQDQMKQLQLIFEKTTQDVKQVLCNLNQKSQNENFVAQFENNFSQIIVDEISNQQIENISSQQNINYHEILQEKFTSFRNENLSQINDIYNLNFDQKILDIQQFIENLNQSSNQNFKSSQQINNSEDSLFYQSQNFQDSVEITQASKDDRVLEKFQKQ